MSAFDRVLAQPASLAARYALLEKWKASNHPQAELLEKQLAYRLITGPTCGRIARIAWPPRSTH